MCKQLQTTIEISKLTLGDWLLIAQAKDNSNFWGFYAWLQNTNEDLNQLTKQDIDAIANKLDRNAWYVHCEIDNYKK
jgi:hypothetical protein